MTTRLAVLLSGSHVADLERTRSGSVRLTYRSARSIDSTPLSLALPAGPGSFAGEAVERWLWGLLPESDDALAAVRRLYGADPRDPLSLLAVIGLDCAGAVQFCLPDDVSNVATRAALLEHATPASVEARLAQMRLDDAASWTMPEDHWSLGGTQQKLTLHRQGDRWFWPRGSAPSTHIVKPGVRTAQAQTLIEHVTTRAAVLIGLSAAHTTYADFASERAIVSTRFDRRSDHDGVTRLHQEDLCQALGIREKYQESGGPSARDVVKLLRDRAATARQASANVAGFLDCLIFNTLVAAPDAHARNFAVLLDGDDVAFAPMYDVATGLAYRPSPGRSRVLSMSIGGTYDADLITVDTWRRSAQDLAVSSDEVLARVQAIGAALPPAFETALSEVDDWDGSVTEVRDRLLPELDRRFVT